MDNILLIIILFLIVIQMGSIFLLARLVGNLLSKIKKINGVQFNTLSVGNTPPLFRAIDEQGKKVVISELFKTKKTLLLFINTSCSTCKSILPELKEMIINHEINLVLINIDESKDDNEIKKMLTSDFTYIRSTQIATSYDIPKVPYALLINKDGVIDYHGEVDSSIHIMNILTMASVS